MSEIWILVIWAAVSVVVSLIVGQMIGWSDDE
jgi:hypothetical protein